MAQIRSGPIGDEFAQSQLAAAAPPPPKAEEPDEEEQADETEGEDAA